MLETVHPSRGAAGAIFRLPRASWWWHSFTLMQNPSRHWSAIIGLAFILGSTPSLWAMGSPPLNTDDPDTPGDRHWEINVGLSTERRPGERASELPLIDLNYGVGDRVQLKFEVPYLHLSEEGGSSESAVGNSEFGVKWRFYDAGEKGPAVSVYPQLEFNTPGSSAERLGLAERGSAFKVPFQFQQDVGPATIVAQAGVEFRAGDERWFYGVSAGHHFTDKVEVAAELFGDAPSGLHRSMLAANLGVSVELSEKTSVMFSVGRELHNHAEEKATFLGYVGVQWRL